MSLLCRLGLHKDRDIWRGPFDGWSQVVQYGCLRCGREERVTFISPLSGPRRGEMHPDAGKPWDDCTVRVTR